MQSKFLLFVFCFICFSFITLKASVPDTLSVLSFKQYDRSSLNEYYCIISDSTLSDNDRVLHDSILICSVFTQESVTYDHGHLTGLMRLNALSDSVQKRADSEFAKSAGRNSNFTYDQEYLIKPSFVNAALTIYEVDYSAYRNGLLVKNNVSYIYINKQEDKQMHINDLLKKNITGITRLLQKYLLIHLNELRPGIDHEVEVLKYQGYKNLDKLDEVAVYSFTPSHMVCVFNSSAISNSQDRIMLYIPLREVTPFLCKPFVKILR